MEAFKFFSKLILHSFQHCFFYLVKPLLTFTLQQSSLNETQCVNVFYNLASDPHKLTHSIIALLQEHKWTINENPVGIESLTLKLFHCHLRHVFYDISENNAINKNLDGLQEAFFWCSHYTVDIWFTIISDVIVSEDASYIKYNMLDE